MNNYGYLNISEDIRICILYLHMYVVERFIYRDKEKSGKISTKQDRKMWL